jgi:hypothetical protein
MDGVMVNAKVAREMAETAKKRNIPFMWGTLNALIKEAADKGETKVALNCQDVKFLDTYKFVMTEVIPVLEGLGYSCKYKENIIPRSNALIISWEEEIGD